MNLIKKYFWRVLISLIGLSLIINPMFFTALGMIGQTTNGTITSYRRILGERPEAIPNQYTYRLGYQFFINGIEYSGSTTVIGSPLFMKPDGISVILIKYLEKAPYLSGLERDTHLDLGKFTVGGAGLLLIYVMNPIKKNKKRKRKS